MLFTVKSSFFPLIYICSLHLQISECQLRIKKIIKQNTEVSGIPKQQKVSFIYWKKCVSNVSILVYQSTQGKGGTSPSFSSGIWWWNSNTFRRTDIICVSHCEIIPFFTWTICWLEVHTIGVSFSKRISFEKWDLGVAKWTDSPSKSSQISGDGINLDDHQKSFSMMS